MQIKRMREATTHYTVINGSEYRFERYYDNGGGFFPAFAQVSAMRWDDDQGKWVTVHEWRSDEV